MIDFPNMGWPDMFRHFIVGGVWLAIIAKWSQVLPLTACCLSPVAYRFL